MKKYWKNLSEFSFHGLDKAVGSIGKNNAPWTKSKYKFKLLKNDFLWLKKLFYNEPK